MLFRFLLRLKVYLLRSLVLYITACLSGFFKIIYILHRSHECLILTYIKFCVTAALLYALGEHFNLQMTIIWFTKFLKFNHKTFKFGVLQFINYIKSVGLSNVQRE